MRAFRIGYILTVAFMLILMVVTITFGYFPAPQGPKAPQYPDYSTYGSAYQAQSQKYSNDLKKYENEQKTFMQAKVIPYATNVFVGWIMAIIIFQAIGVVLTKYISEMVGAAYSFSGVWAVILGPLGGMLWFLNGLVSSLGRRAEQPYSLDPLFQSLGIALLIGILILSVVGVVLYRKTISKKVATA